MFRYLLAGAGAAGAYYLAPTVWDNISITALGLKHQSALVCAIGAWLGGLLGEMLASKDRK